MSVAQVRAAEFVVHEWGTFTAVSGSDGKLLSGLETEEEVLPPFVLNLEGGPFASKGRLRPVKNVTIKMETPVIYFYSDVPRTMQVDVAFRGGSISQWYPDRSAGEPRFTPSQAEIAKGLPAIDFARASTGAASWRVDVLGPTARDAFSARPEMETPQWPRARVAAANRLRGPKGEVENFIFYRGIGRFDLPLRTTIDAAGTLRLANAGADAIPFVLVLDVRPQSPAGSVAIVLQGLGAGETRSMDLRNASGALSLDEVRERVFPDALVAAGLTPDEARAMMATWRESYFERAGLRVFWIVPRAFTDAVLPITIAPRPDKLERVLVGRTEVLTPGFEAQLARSFAASQGMPWMSDRYYLAYRERARALGVVDVAPPVAAP